MRQRVGRSIARAKFINTALLGRKRPVMERVVDIAHVDSSKAIQPLMKEEVNTVLKGVRPLGQVVVSLKSGLIDNI